MHAKKLLAVFPLVEWGYESSAKPTSGWCQPMGLVALMTAAKRELPGLEIALYDFRFQSRKIDELIDEHTLVAVYATVRSYEFAIREVTEIASENGATVVLGGPYPTVRWRQILTNQPSVDYVVRQHGERALVDLLRGHAPSRIQNLAYRVAGGTPESNSVLELGIQDSPLPDLSLIDLSPYSHEFRKLDVDFSVPITFESSRGCWWRHISPGCNFCAITPRQYTQQSPAVIREYLESAHDLHGVDFVYDVSDNIGSDPGWLETYADATRDLGIALKCYLSAECGARRDVVATLAGMNCVDVFVGYESADHGGLRAVHKRAGPVHNKRCAEMLAEYGIPTVAGFIVGKEGDTEEQVERDIELAEWMVSLGNVNIVYVSMMKSIPGTILFDDLLRRHPSFSKKYKDADVINTDELKADSIPLLSSLSWERAQQLAQRFEEIDPGHIEYRKRRALSNKLVASDRY